MITASTIIGFALLAMRQVQQKDEFAWKPSKVDVMKLREEMSKYEPQMINGRKQYPIELVLRDRGGISFGDYGERQIVSPQIYKQTEDIYGLHQWMQEKDQDQLFQAYPEERVAWDQKIREMFASMRKVSLKELIVK